MCGCAGTKRPLRCFFVWLTIPGKAFADGQKLAYLHKQAKLPRDVRLTKLPMDVRDSDSCGIWNQWEFGLQLLRIGKRADWNFAEMNYEQRSLDTFVVTEVKREFQAAAVQEPAAAASSSKPEKKVDDSFDIFEAFCSPLLKAGKPQHDTEAAQKAAQKPVVEARESSDEDVLGLAEEAGSEAGFLAVASSPENSDVEGDAADRAEASNRASSAPHKPHEAATDFSIIQSVLGDRPLCPKSYFFFPPLLVEAAPCGWLQDVLQPWEGVLGSSLQE